ncbi:hypothetical protein CGI53_23765, partial [Vibrio parahaemolyticus]
KILFHLHLMINYHQVLLSKILVFFFIVIRIVVFPCGIQVVVKKGKVDTTTMIITLFAVS